MRTGFMRLAAGCLVGVAGARAAAGPPYLLDLGAHQPEAVSDDGRVIAGRGGPGGNLFHWTNPAAGTGGLVYTGFGVTANMGLSGDGKVVLHGCCPGGGVSHHAAKWTNPTTGGTGVEQLGVPTNSWSLAVGASFDGRVVVGMADNTKGFIWTDPTSGGSGSVWIPPLPGYSYAHAGDVSADGSVVVGRAWSPGIPVPVQWANGVPQVLGQVTGPTPTSNGTIARTVSADGAVVVGDGSGYIGSTPWRRGYKWKSSTGLVNLPHLGTANNSLPWGVSGDGSVVVGDSFLWTTVPGPSTAVMWDQSNSVAGVKTMLETQYGLNLSGWSLESARGISSDGRTIIGSGTNPLGQSVGWLAFLGDSCYPDCNADGQLTVADFGCFQTKFVAADPYADCNADGQRTVADFGCFQTKFVAGCP